MSINKSVYNIKIILLGETGVGKTNLINAYFGNSFVEDVLGTISPKQSHETIEINDKICFIDMWDTMGQEKYRSLTTSFIKGSHIIIFVYDITNQDSFKSLNYWVEAVKENINDYNIILGLTANKMDLFNKSEVSKEKGEKYAKEIGAFFNESSAKENPKGFKKFVKKLLEKLFLDENSIKKEGNIIEKSFESNDSENTQKKKKKNCC